MEDGGKKEKALTTYFFRFDALSFTVRHIHSHTCAHKGDTKKVREQTTRE